MLNRTRTRVVAAAGCQPTRLYENWAVTLVGRMICNQSERLTSRVGIVCFDGVRMAEEEATPAASHPIALAYAAAVAAMQTGVDEVPSTKVTIDPALLPSPSAAQVTSLGDVGQGPGSGTDFVQGMGRVSSSSSSGGDADDDDVENAVEKLARCRERNREHARKTRQRKKAHLHTLQGRVKGLEAERTVLKQQIEECSIASILLGLSSGEQDDSSDALLGDSPAKAEARATKVALLAAGKRKRFASEIMGEKQAQPLKLKIDGKLTLIGGGRSHINWKTGHFVDEDGSQKQLSQEQLEKLRRERNRMHAKMTRDRKKSFISTIESTVEELESDIHRMKDILAKVAAAAAPPVAATNSEITPTTSPEPKSSTSLSGNDDSSDYSEDDKKPPVDEDMSSMNKASHGFLLAG